VAAAAAGVVVLWLGTGPVLARLQSDGGDAFADIRWAVYQRTLTMAGERPVLGFGLGTYADAFTRFQPPGVPGGKIVDHAHNDYLQLAAEAGLAGVGLLAWALLALAAFAVGRWRRRHDPFVRGLTLGGLGALTALAVHSALDFGLRVPAVALTGVAVAALVVNGVALRTHRGAGGGVDLPARTWRVAGGRRAAGLAVVVVAVALGAVALVPAARAAWVGGRAEALAGGRAREAGQTGMADLVAAHAALGQAVRLEPANPASHGRLAAVAAEIALRTWVFGLGPDGRLVGRDPAARLAASQGYFATAVAAYRRALAGNPVSAALHDRYAGLLVLLDDIAERVRGSARLRVEDARLAAVLDAPGGLLPEARRHFEEAVRLDPLNPARHRNLGLFALSRLPEPEGRALAAASFRRALEAEPRLLPDVVEHLEAAGAPRPVVADALPPRDEVWRDLARRWEERDRREDAGWAYQQALAHATDPARQVPARLAYGRFLLRTGHARDALEQTRLALVLEPGSDEVQAALAAIYEALGEWANAASALAAAASAVEPADPARALGYRDLLAELHLRRGDLDQAVAVRRAMAAATPGDALAHFQLGRMLHLRRDWAEAERAYQASLALDRTDARTVRHLAFLRVEQGRGAEGLAVLEEAVASRPTVSELRLSLAEVYERLGQPGRAAEQYRDVLARHPGHPAARRGLASLGAAGGGPRP
jgi:tetratricopeptide (TPR) repeat protein